MQTGLDEIATGFSHGLEGRKIALLCNHTAVDQWGRHAAEILPDKVPGLEIVRLLGPEHGVWSTHQDMEPVDGGAVDPVFGIEVASLYGRDAGSLRPRPEALAGVDAIVYDVADIGSRYYTYASTLLYAMEAAQDAGIGVWVLDRPNPLGSDVEGPILHPGFESFCGVQAGLPIRHGLTVGNLARWLHRERGLKTELHVVECDALAQPIWVPPSPNMPTIDTARVYPGMCLLEGTTISEGRGTTTPFLLFGAPGVDPLALKKELQHREIPGVEFIPRRFRPAFQKHAGDICGGLYIRLSDARALFSSVALGVHVLDALKRTAPDQFAWREDAYEFVEDVPAIDLLWGSAALRETIDAGKSVEPLLKSIFADKAKFKP